VGRSATCPAGYTEGVIHRFLLGFVLVVCAAGATLRFRITLAKEAAAGPVSGRMLVFMEEGPEKRERIEPGWFDRSWMAAQEYANIAPGETVDFDPDIAAWPRPFSQAAAGKYQVMAVLDRDHDYNYRSIDDDDIYSAVVMAELPAAGLVELTLSKTGKGRVSRQLPYVELAEFESPLLSRFWGRPVRMRAGVVLPPSYEKEPERSYPAMYVHHGYGGDYTGAYWFGPLLRRLMGKPGRMEAVQVYLDGSCPTGDHEFADSVNNGPWGRALVEEFIPYLERRYRLIAKPEARFLTGHSSGGWASLWDQITYPEFFGGTWSTAPDPVDFRSFTGIDATPGSHDNAYRTPDGKAHNLARRGAKDLISWEDFAKREAVLGEYGGQAASFEWVFSPRGEDGRPMQLFNRVTGELSPEVERAWQKYDIRRTLAEHWGELGPRLKGKLNIIVGGADTFHLEESVEMLCDFLKRAGSDAVCEVVPGRDHMDLYAPSKAYPDGLNARILSEMTARFERASK
jgi:hypothetical protein